jgi:hypothetical protein
MTKTVKLLRDQLRDAQGWLEATLVDVKDEHMQVKAPGKANPLGATYAHAVMAEDGIVHGMLQGKMPLMVTTYAKKIGVDKPMPQPGPEWAHYEDWTRNVKVNLKELREYAQAVYTAAENYIAGLTDEDLEKPIDLTHVGQGQRTVAWIISTLLIGHLHDMTGEVSVLKGIQGLKGYPF